MNNIHLDLDLLDILIEQVESAASASGGRTNVSKWLCNNTSHPLNPNKPWSFDEHEFQLEIVDSQHPRNDIQKASQIGVSEVLVRTMLALLVKKAGIHAIYSLPDATFAKKFAPARFDPIIAASKKLKRLVDRDLNNNEIKKIGSSYLYIVGSQKESQSISTPASVLFKDEVAYSNKEVIGTLNSRLGHLRRGEEIVYGFSTPLLPGSDINHDFEQGTKDSYMCYHDACNTWVVVDPILHIRVPGLQVPIEMFSKDDLKDTRVKIEEAYVECSHCKKPITIGNLADPNKRAWVPEYPDRYTRSFDANFLVLPSIRTPSRVLYDRANYRSTGKWVNFAIGRPAESADMRITTEAVERCFQITAVSPEESEKIPQLNVVMGMDIGKTGHLVVARKQPGRLEVIHVELPRQDPDNYLAQCFTVRNRQYRARKGVIDAGPEFTVVTQVQTKVRYNSVLGCYFTRGAGKSDLSFYEVQEERGVVLVQRTKAFDEFISEFNKGNVLLPRNSPHEPLIRQHLINLARVTDFDAVGEETARWVSTGPDHFLFAIFYCWLAADMMVRDTRVVLMPASMTFASKVRMK